MSDSAASYVAHVGSGTVGIGGSDARSAGWDLMTRRYPCGPVLMVTPFNFPLNLAAHKVAPAIAAGCPFVLKPSDVAPLSAGVLMGMVEGT
jgi:acyl-CoA reductase-like NAD-dependent aldehyde dehydrogenase